MNFRHMLLIVRARWRLAGSIFGGIVVLVAVLNVLLPKQYVASASIVVNIRPDPAAGAVPSDLLAAYLATQVEIIASTRVSKRVVQQLQLDKDPLWQQRWREATNGRGDVTDWVAARLARKLKILPNGDSDVVNLSVTWTDGKTAAAIANAFAQGYLATALDLKIDPARQYASTFSTRAGALRAELEAKQKLLSDFENETGIIATDERLDVENSRLTELSSQLVAIQGLRQESQSRKRQAIVDHDSIPEVLQSPLIATLKTELSQAETKLDDMATQLGTSNPQYQSTAAEVDGLRKRLLAETNKIVNSLSNATRVNEEREQQIAAALDAQRQRILELRHQHDKAQILQNDVLTAQRNLDAVTQRLAQSSLEDNSLQTDVVLLASATEPLEYSSPKILLNCLLAAFAGAGIGIAVVLLLEGWDQRIRSDVELARLLDVPVLGRIGSVTARTRRLPSPNRLLPHISS
jgi:chain length determinant protein EpsF